MGEKQREKAWGRRHARGKERERERGKEMCEMETVQGKRHIKDNGRRRAKEEPLTKEQMFFRIYMKSLR